jgi:hypothetical protein
MLTFLSTTTVGNTFEQLAFGLFGSSELFGFAVIIAVMLLMGVSSLPPRFMLIVASILVIGFSFVYGGAVYTTLTVIIVLVYGYLLSNMFFKMFQNR